MPTTVTATNGLKLQIEELDPGDMLDLFEIAGGAASSQAWVIYASTVCAVRAVDDVPIPFPTNKAEIKAIARRLGAQGVAAAIDAIRGEVEVDVEAAKEAAKNLAGIPSSLTASSS